MRRILLLCLGFFLAVSGLANAQELTWRNIGPAIVGGAVNEIAGAQFTGSDGRPVLRIYVAGPGGLFASDDEGAWWTPLTDDMRGTSAVSSLAVSPYNQHEVWIASGDTNAVFRTVPGNGLFKSVDDGKHWQPSGLNDVPLIQFIRFDPRTQGTLYAGVIGDLRHPNEKRGLYRSTDGGATWQRVLFTNGWSGAVDIAFDPADKNVLYAAMQQQGTDRRVYRDYGPGSGVFKSIDGGSTWQRLNIPVPSGTLTARSAVAVAPSQANRVYAVVQVVPAAGSGLGSEDPVKHAVALYRSSDGGAHWTRGADLHLDIFSLYGHVYVDPAKPDRVYALREGLAVSNDGGKTFDSRDNIDNPQKPEYSGPDDHALWIDPQNSAHLILGGDHGVFVSWTAGKSWRHVESLIMARTYGLGIGAEAPFTRVVAAMQDSYDYAGLLRSPGRDGITNADWIPLRIGSENGNAAVDPQDQNIIYANGAYGAQKIERTDLRDGFKIALGPPVTLGGIEPPDAARRGTIMFGGSQEHPILYFGTNRVMRSRDRGAHWEAISPVFSPIDSRPDDLMGMNGKAGSLFWAWGLYDSAIDAIGLSPIDPRLLYAGTRGGALAVTRDGGKHWKNLTTPHAVGGAEVTGIAASRFRPGRVYASFTRFYESDYRPYIYKSEDYGAHWRSVAPPIAGATVWSLLEHPERNGMVIAATSRGILATTNDGSNWFRVGKNFPNVFVTDLRLQPKSNALVAATWGRGVWVLDDLTTLSQPQIPGCAQLYAVRPAAEYTKTHWTDYEAPVFAAPNPTVDGAAISYYVPPKMANGRHAKIRITAPDGTLITALRAPFTPGLHQLAWDLRLPKLGKRDSVGPFVLPGTYEASLEPPSGVCAQRARSTFAVTIAGQTPALLASYQRAYPQRVMVYRLENRVHRIGAALGKYADYMQYLKSHSTPAQRSAVTTHFERVTPIFTHLQRIFVSSTYGTGESFFLFQTASEAIQAFREELDGVTGYEGNFTALMPAEENLLMQIQQATRAAEPQIRAIVQSERVFLQNLPAGERNKAQQKLAAVESAL